MRVLPTLAKILPIRREHRGVDDTVGVPYCLAKYLAGMRAIPNDSFNVFHVNVETAAGYVVLVTWFCGVQFVVHVL